LVLYFSNRFLEPIEQKTVNFYGDEITTALVKVSEEAKIFVPIRPICDYLGLNWSAQLQRLKRDLILSKKFISVFITHTEKGKGGGQREMIALDLDYLAGWLFGVDPSRVKPELKERVLLYQEFCYSVIRSAVANSLVIDPFATKVISGDYSPNPVLLEIEKVSLAVAEMARQQIELEQRQFQLEQQLNNNIQRVNEASRVVGGMLKRIDRIEEWIEAQPNYINERQAGDVSRAVREVAETLYEAQGGKLNTYFSRVFTALYEKFGVPSYKEIPKEQFSEVIQFLNEWKNKPDTPKQGSLF
jgi:hypothetical protein